MSHTPATIGDVFRAHGITIAIGAPMMRIQELALAISLNGRHRVGAGYRGLDHLIEVSIYERVGSLWTTKRTMTAALPNEASDQRQRELAIVSLDAIVTTLEQLLQEGPQS